MLGVDEGRLAASFLGFGDDMEGQGRLARGLRPPHIDAAPPLLAGRPTGFTLVVTDVVLKSGAGFVVALCGDIMTMPGLPKVPAAERVDVDGDGEISGLS